MSVLEISAGNPDTRVRRLDTAGSENGSRSLILTRPREV